MELTLALNTKRAFLKLGTPERVAHFNFLLLLLLVLEFELRVFQKT
jgi:hypothetical protein